MTVVAEPKMRPPVDSASKRVILHAGGDSTSALADVADHLANPRRAIFLPYAGHDYDRYTAQAQERRYDPIGVKLLGLHTFDDPIAAIGEADAIIVGGGNSFRLVAALHRLGIIDAVRAAVAAGVPYYGGSAGANVGCPSVRTTNDMPIIEAPSLWSFSLVGFQINPHYMDPLPQEFQRGETREQRIHEFLEENDVPVVGLREGSWLRIRGSTVELRGSTPARLFRQGQEPEEYHPGSDLSFLSQAVCRYGG